jgi:hypothetical protein
MAAPENETADLDVFTHEVFSLIYKPQGPFPMSASQDFSNSDEYFTELTLWFTTARRFLGTRNSPFPFRALFICLNCRSFSRKKSAPIRAGFALSDRLFGYFSQSIIVPCLSEFFVERQSLWMNHPPSRSPSAIRLTIDTTYRQRINGKVK